MRILRVLSFFLLAGLLTCCNCSNSKQARFRLGIDPNWYPLNFEVFQPLVNGFMEDLLLEISRYNGVEFVKMEANWDSLMEGLQEGQYDAVITSLSPHGYLRAKYDFSPNLLQLGPVLIIPTSAQSNDLDKLSNKVVGVVVGDPAFLLLQKYPEIIVRKYEMITDLLEAIATGSIEGALLDRLVALSFVRDRYAGQLKIAPGSLTDSGLRLVSLKGRQSQLMDLFDRSLSRLEKQKKLQSFQAKWQLGT